MGWAYWYYNPEDSCQDCYAYLDITEIIPNLICNAYKDCNCV